MSIEQIIISFSYLGIFLLMISNGVVSLLFNSSQAIYLIAGYFVYTGDLSFLAVILIGALGNTLGNIVLYEISRKKGLKYILKFKVFPEKEIRKVQAVMKKKGYWFLFFGKLVNPIKVIIPIPAGISKLNRIVFAIIVFITSLIWAIIFTTLGYYFGKTFEFAIYYGLLMITLAFIIMAIFYKYMNSEIISKEIEIDDEF